MIYTVGHATNYRQYFKEQTNPKKAIGGSVWETKAEAEKNCPPGYEV